MIVLDEQLGLQLITAAIAAWYPGRVSNIKEFRPHKRILDPQIPSLLLEAKQPTFVTVNYDDFWRKVAPHSRYCILCLKLEAAQTLLVPEIVREVLRRTEFRSKAKRMGHVISRRNHLVNSYVQ
jgi:aminopeptidase N